MLHIKKPGKRIEQGFNFYPLSDELSAGFVYRYGDNLPGTDLGDKIFIFRYVKLTRSWVIKTSDFKERK